MNEWNENEKYQQQYEHNQRFGTNGNGQPSRSGGNRNNNGSRPQNKKGQHNSNKTNSLLQEIVSQNETMIYLLKGIRYALQNDHPKKKGKGKVPQQKKPYIQRFDKSADSSKKDVDAANAIAEIVEEKIETTQAIIEQAQEPADVYENENEIGEDNPFAMFGESESKE